MVNFKVKFSLKKAIAISFLLFANTIWLAHAIIPHHHHNGLIFILTTAHQAHDCNSHDDNDAHSDGNCDYPLCNSGIENCELATIYAKFDSDKRIVSDNLDLLPVVFALFSNDDIPQITDDTGLPFRQKPYLISHTEYISQSIGLRAPPAC